MAVKVIFFLALVLLGFAWFVDFRASRAEARAEAMYPPEGQFVEVAGKRVHVVIMGSGPDLVLIHGSSGNTRDMTFALAPELAKSFRVLVFDRPGLGYSDVIGMNGASLGGQASVLMRAAKQLGANKPLVMGQSYGGGVALAWAVTFPDAIAGLVLVSSVASPWKTPLAPYYKVTSSALGSAIVVPIITAFAPSGQIEASISDVFAPQALPQGYLSYIAPGLSLRRTSARENALQRANLLDEVIALTPRFREINMPVEIVHGTNDDIVDLSLHTDFLMGQISSAVLTKLQGIGHMPHQVATRDVIAAIERVAARAGLR